MTNLRQVVTFEVDLHSLGNGVQEFANEIIINGKGYGPADLEQKMKRGSYAKEDVRKLFAAIETVALWAADKDQWEVLT